MSSLRTQSTGGGVLGLSSVGSDRTGATSTAAGSHSHSHRKHHHHHRSRSAPRAPEKPPRKRHLNPGHSLASIPSQIKLSMLNSGLISFDGLLLRRARHLLTIPRRLAVSGPPTVFPTLDKLKDPSETLTFTSLSTHMLASLLMLSRKKSLILEHSLR